MLFTVQSILRQIKKIQIKGGLLYYLLLYEFLLEQLKVTPMNHFAIHVETSSLQALYCI